MGNKVAAKKAARDAGIPVVSGSDGPVVSTKMALEVAEEISYPVIIKASAGGGGRGMKVAHSPEELRQGLKAARNEALAVFGNGEVYIERFLSHPRHIEVQILADLYGTVVHLGERDCSLQRRHQKLLEEAPSPALNDKERDQIGAIARNAMISMGYRSVGTLEFLYQDDAFYFIEMNTRLQVEHPVTEMICGLDLVREMVRVAAGAPLGFSQKDIRFSGHAIECRITAEHPETFIPSPGRVEDYHAPGGLGVRVDSALYSGYAVPPHYDSMIAKLIVHGATRNECLMRLRRALGEYVIGGLDTTIALHQRLVAEPAFVNGDYDIHWLERFVDSGSS
jgi:acetyl-CoA carboxylase biotin carboxylase subunit